MTTALLVIDLQRALCEGRWAMHGIADVLDRVHDLAARARAAGAPVVFIQHQSADGPLVVDSEGWQLSPELTVHPGDWRVNKRHGDGFLRTDLHARLQACGVTEVLLCGAQSDFCVSATAQGALSHGNAVTLVADAHATLANGVLSAEQIVAHVNATVPQMDSYGPRVRALPCADIGFAA